MADAAGADDRAAVEARLSRLLGEPVRILEAVGGGRNSRVYKVDACRLGACAAKHYWRARGGRDHLGAERAALEFLRRHGEERVPRPIAADPEGRLLVSQFVDGVRADEGVTDADVDAAIDFLAALKGLAGAAGSQALPEASEACFSVRAALDAVDARRRRLAREGDFEALDGALGAFLEGEFDPALAAVRAQVEQRLAAAGAAGDAPLPRPLRTLSPSDFGFHNALRRADGALVFLDFEHFGWDDPAKMIADVLHHPGMALSAAHRERFRTGLLQRFADDEHLASRLATVHPVHGLKWCAILLNEFVAADLRRREHASQDGVERGALRAQQLGKARRMLASVRDRL